MLLDSLLVILKNSIYEHKETGFHQIPLVCYATAPAAAAATANGNGETATEWWKSGIRQPQLTTESVVCGLMRYTHVGDAGPLVRNPGRGRIFRNTTIAILPLTQCWTPVRQFAPGNK